VQGTDHEVVIADPGWWLDHLDELTDALALSAAHVLGLGPSWACGLAAVQRVLAAVVAIRPRQRHHPR
jgi:hypothetical protein